MPSSSFYADEGDVYEALNNSDTVIATMTNLAAAAQAASTSASDTKTVVLAAQATVHTDRLAADASASAANTANTAAYAAYQAANQAAQNASQSATTASTAAGTATTKADTATTQAGIALTQAGIATTKAGEAATSAAAALQSKTNAGTSETNAATSAAAALASQNASYTNAVNAAGSNSVAAQHEANAMAYRDDAAAKATTATTQAGIATTKAGEAAASATAAATSKTNAATSETNAAASATAAATSKTGTDTALSTLQALIALNGPSPQVRLTLNSGVALSLADIAGATVVYMTSVDRGIIPYNGTYKQPGQLALTLDANASHTGYHQAGRTFDLFYHNDGFHRLGTGPSWEAGATPGQSKGAGAKRGVGAGSTEIEWYNGFPVNKNTLSLRVGPGATDVITVAPRWALYLGSMHTVGDGMTSDTRSQRLLYNAYNQFERELFLTDPTTSYNYSDSAFAYAFANPANKISILLGLSGPGLRLSVFSTATSSTATPRNLGCAVGLDGLTLAPNQLLQYSTAVVGQVASCTGVWNGHPGTGMHDLYWLNRGSGADIQTWLGTPSFFPSGMSGSAYL